MTDTSRAALPAMQEALSRTDRVAETIRQAILEGTFAPGQALVERELAERLGISKTPVREALRMLLPTGLVENSSYQGIRVRTLDVKGVRSLYEARLIVESAAVRIAVERHGASRIPDGHEQLDIARRAMEQDDLVRLGLANRAFHRALYLRCDNAILVETLDRLQNLGAFAALHGWRAHPTWKEEFEEHTNLLAAAEAGDSALAERLTSEHISKSAMEVLQSLEQD